MSSPQEFGEVIFEFDVLYAGWDVDSKGYVVRDAEGVNRLVLSDHGRWYLAEPNELLERMQAYKSALMNSLDALVLIDAPYVQLPILAPRERSDGIVALLVHAIRSDKTPEELANLTRMSYTRVQGQACPYCAGPAICNSSPPSRMIEKVYEGNKEMVRQRAECESCGRSWWDVFLLAQVEELAEGEE